MSPNALIQLMYLYSPTLPIGAFTYSQGMEWAVDCGWITHRDSAMDWLTDQLEQSLAHVDVPILKRLAIALAHKDSMQVAFWGEQLLAFRETAELRAEERQRAQALCRILQTLEVPVDVNYVQTVQITPLVGYALAGAHWQIPLSELAMGYVWSWLDNQVTSAIKIVPLGQTAGQQMLKQLLPKIPSVVQMGLRLTDEDLGASLPRLAIASSRHETQYTRLFRS